MGEYYGHEGEATRKTHAEEDLVVLEEENAKPVEEDPPTKKRLPNQWISFSLICLIYVLGEL